MVSDVNLHPYSAVKALASAKNRAYETHLERAVALLCEAKVRRKANYNTIVYQHILYQYLL